MIYTYPKIEHAFFDLDGCLSNDARFTKDLPLDLYMEMPAIKEFLQFMRMTDVRRAAATGRSLTISRLLIDLLMNDLSVAEHGTVLYDPRYPHVTRHLVDEISKYDGLRAAKDTLEEFIGRAHTFDDDLARHCEAHGFRARRLEDNKHTYTIEVHPQGEQNSNIVAAYVESQLMIPSMIEYLRSGKIRKMISGEAVDYLPPVSKRDGVVAIIKMKGLDPSNVLAVGDSYHSDGPMMEEIAGKGGYVICPANSDKSLKQLVATQGKRGYVASQSFVKGTMEGLKHFLAY